LNIDGRLFTAWYLLQLYLAALQLVFSVRVAFTD
jgi:hypothetical protein